MSGSLYLAAQRLRGGVTPAMIRTASGILNRDPAAMAAYLSARLRAQFGPEAGRPGWLAEQPTVVRTALMELHQAEIATGTRWRREVRRTSGSTGTPFRFVKSTEMTAWMDATMWAGYAWHGIRPGDRQLRFWGMPPHGMARHRRRAIDWVSDRIRYDAFSQSAVAAKRFLLRAERFRPRYGYGYPTLMAAFAADCTAQGIDGTSLELKVVISTGEVLQPAQGELLKAFFGCPIVNEYGCTESGILAFGCEHGTSHLLPVAALAEIVDSEGQGTNPGETGEVVVTDLYGRTLPLLRYRLHDRAATAPIGTCRCGRSLPGLSIAVGRQDGFIRTPSGREVYDAILAYSVPDSVQRFRARQTALARIEVSLVPRPGADPRAMVRDTVAAWEAALGGEIRVEATVVPDLPFDASGKLRYFLPLQDECDRTGGG